MIFQFSLAALLASAIIFVIIAFVECLVSESECQHEKHAIYDSYHKKVCLDCGKEFPTKGDK